MLMIHYRQLSNIREVSRFNDILRFMGKEERRELVLEIWEAVNSERELDGVLAAVARLLAPVVNFQGIAIVTFDRSKGRPFALHVVEHAASARIRPDPRPSIPYSGSELEKKLQSVAPYSCPDLLEKDGWLPHEFRLAAAGLRSYAAIPLTVRGTRLGLAAFTRRVAQAFSTDELALLGQVSRAIGIAVANALANDEIRTLRDQLEAENVALRSQLEQARGFEEIIGDAPALRAVLEAIQQVAPTDATVLVSGETGTGKELVARAIHNLSPRAQAPLVTVNCAAIPATLIASELFGHERGAFTGATERRKGRFEQAHGGTLFLDEIGDLPIEVQVALLRVLQERQFERLGGQQSIQVDVRLITATNRDLAEEVRTGRFRSDLFYRLSVFPIRVPALRERPEDIAPLVAHFAMKYGTRFDRSITRIDRRSMKALESYAWPGNVRELENIIERAVILARNGILRVDVNELPGVSAAGNLPGDLLDREREAIELALRNSAGRVSGPTGAAGRLGIPASTLESRIKRLGLDKFRYRSGAQK
jgi:formate hydrogenlyase transcriptional activator